MNQTFRLGIDIGSTTVKTAVIDNDNQILFADYERHYANIQETLAALFKKGPRKAGRAPGQRQHHRLRRMALSGHLNIPFTQEVVAVATALQDYAPDTDVAIELGGEDAKIIYFSGGIDQRMNGICAGGTGSFIDQMASLFTDRRRRPQRIRQNYKAIYPIAARCGVFAKSDIQPLINEGATREDLAASIFQAVVNQTISGLACGKPIRGNVAFLGGPLHFLSELREAFIRTLNLKGDAIIAPGPLPPVRSRRSGHECPGNHGSFPGSAHLRPFRRDQNGLRGKADGPLYLRMRPTTRNSWTAITSIR